jgi:FKBP-type peptidyl-prolyl cis-trans isomerase FkpA
MRALLALLVLTLPVLAACDSNMPTSCPNVGTLTMLSDTPGTGQAVTTSSTVVVNYRGTLPDGTVFDSTRAGSSACFSLLGTISGFRLGIGGATVPGSDGNTVIPPMRLGGSRTIRIPPQLGYGTASQRGIPSCSTLQFEIELLDAPGRC